MLKSDRATKALSGVSLSLGSVLFRLMREYVAKVTRETWRGRGEGEKWSEGGKRE